MFISTAYSSGNSLAMGSTKPRTIIARASASGNLILYQNFYPAAYVRPESSTAVLNAEEPFPPNENFHKLQRLIKETCETIIECYSVDELIEFVDMNRDFGK